MYKVAFALLLWLSACSTEPPKKELSVSEQIKVDTKNAEGLSSEFKQQVGFIAIPKAVRFLEKTAQKILNQKREFEAETIKVQVHGDSQVNLQRFFSFPGILLSVPASFLKKVEFENELAAALAFEIANIMDRVLAQKVEAQRTSGKPELFGAQSVFGLTEKIARVPFGLQLHFCMVLDSILVGWRQFSGATPSIMHRLLQARSRVLPIHFKKEVDFNVREAQLAKSEFLPQMKPIVRSGEFIQFKKELLKMRR